MNGKTQITAAHSPLLQAAELLERGFGFGVGPDEIGELTKKLRDIHDGMTTPEWMQLGVALAMHPPMLSALAMAAGERARQVEFEGYKVDHDDGYKKGELRRAAAAYLLPHVDGRFPPQFWPWDTEHFKPKDEGRDTVRGIGLALAELERQERAARA